MNGKKTEPTSQAGNGENTWTFRGTRKTSVFKRFAEASRQGVGIADFDGIITYCNPQLCFYVGEKSPEDAIGKSFFQYYSPTHQQRLREEILPQVLNKGHWVGELELYTLDGRTVHTIENFFLIRDESGAPQYFGDLVTDITEQKHIEELLENQVEKRTAKLARINEDLKKEINRRKEVEKELRESERRYRIVTKHTGDGITVLQDGIIVFANDAFCAMFGYDASEELLGREVSIMLSPETRKTLLPLLDAIVSGDTRERIYRGNGRTRQGEELWVEGLHTLIQWEGRPAVLAAIRDISETVAREMATRREAEALRKQNIKLAATVTDRYRLHNLVGKSPAMQDVYENILSASTMNVSVVLYGESGTGKELVARAIHELSERSAGPFVPVNCGAIPEHLMESEFFGHRRGAFTSADMDKKGYLDFANGGTLFLDEVGEISQGAQVKLLRAIEGGGHTPLGSNVVVKSDFRVVAATNRPLSEMVAAGEMRKDFFYRIHIVPIHLPPLRDRKEDIVLLVDHFLKSSNEHNTPKALPGNIIDALLDYDWPGNVRELYNVLQRYLSMGRLELATDTHVEPARVRATPVEALGRKEFRSKIARYEKQLLIEALEMFHWRRSQAAEYMGIPRRTLFNKMKKHGLK